MAAKTMRLGPVLGYEWDSAEAKAFYTVLVVTDDGAPLWEVNGKTVKMTKVGEAKKLGVWKGKVPWGPPLHGAADAQVVQQEKAADVSYRVLDGARVAMKSRLGTDSWSFHVPGTAERPRLAFASCNGFSSPRLAENIVPGAMWAKMESEHKNKGRDGGPFSLLLMGGDQVYCDGILELEGLFTAWWNLLDRKDMSSYSPNPAELDQIDDFYARVYLDQWGGRDRVDGGPEPEKAWPQAMMRMMASVPSVMMWDDHDVFDGWGSYSDGREGWTVYKEIFKAARKYFGIFQQRGERDNVSLLRPGSGRAEVAHFTFGVRFGNFLVVALDNRSERTRTQLMKPGHWVDLRRWVKKELKRAAEEPRGAEARLTVLVMTGVPVVWRKFRMPAEFIPSLGDDVVDHWNHPSHEKDRDHLVHYLFLWASHKVVLRVTLISGDVHVGGMGVLEGRLGVHKGRQVVQVVSSGIVHPEPKYHEWMGILGGSVAEEFEVRGQGIVGRMVRPSGAGESYLVTRNFAVLKEGTDKKLWVNWVCEKEAQYGRPYYPIPNTTLQPTD